MICYSRNSKTAVLCAVSIAKLHTVHHLCTTSLQTLHDIAGLWPFPKTAFCECCISLHECMISFPRNTKSAVLCTVSFAKLNTVHHFCTMGLQTLHDIAGLWPFPKTAFCECCISLHECMISFPRNTKSAVLCTVSFAKLNTVHHFSAMGLQTFHDLAGLWTFSKTAFCECSISLHECMIVCSRIS